MVENARFYSTFDKDTNGIPFRCLKRSFLRMALAWLRWNPTHFIGQHDKMIYLGLDDDKSMLFYLQLVNLEGPG